MALGLLASCLFVSRFLEEVISSVQTIGPILTKLGVNLEWHPGQVIGGSERTSLYRKWRHRTENRMTPLQKTKFWPQKTGKSPKTTKLGTNLTGHQWQGMRAPKVTYPNRKWHHQTGSGAILGPRKPRSQGILVHSLNSNCRVHRWHKLQQEVT